MNLDLKQRGFCDKIQMTFLAISAPLDIFSLMQGTTKIISIHGEFYTDRPAKAYRHPPNTLIYDDWLNTASIENANWFSTRSPDV